MGLVKTKGPVVALDLGRAGEMLVPRVSLSEFLKCFEVHVAIMLLGFFD